MGKVVTDSQGIDFVGMGVGQNLTDHSIRFMFISGEEAAEWTYTVSWPLNLENFICRKHGDLFQTFFFKQKKSLGKCGNLFKHLPGQEGEAA